MSVSSSTPRAGAADDYLHIELSDVLISNYAASSGAEPALAIQLSDVLVSSYATGRAVEDTLQVELSDVLVSHYAALVPPDDAVPLVGVPDFEAMAVG